MSFYGGNQNGAQAAGQQQQIGRQPGAPGLQNVQQVLPPQLFNINVNPNQLHNFFNEHNASQNQLQLNNAQSILLQPQQAQSFPVNLINEQLGVGVSQLITPATQNQMQGLPLSMSSALNFPQTIQVHAQTPPPQTIQQQSQSQGQQSKQQRVFTGSVTKIHDNFGFIDEEVFFQMGVVKGPILPKEGDRVLVEADFNASMPFKWNATRVQIVNIGGSLNSSLNNLSNLQTSQAQHMGFNTSVGIQKQASAQMQPILTSQSGQVRPHGAQPVTIVSNPHSVYSSTTNARGRPPTGIGAAPVPGIPMVAPPIDPKRPITQMGMPVPPDPPSFLNRGMLNSERDLDRDRGHERERSRDGGRERSRERSRDRSRERVRDRSRDRLRERSREKQTRPRSRSRDRVARDRSRDRSRDRDVGGISRDRSKERNYRDRSPDRLHSTRLRSRSRDRSRERNGRDRSPEKRTRVKRDRTPEKIRDRSRERERPRDKEATRDQRKKSASPAREGKKEKQPLEKTRAVRERSPLGSQSHSQTDRSKRSRSKESVRTDRAGHVTERSRSRSSSPRRKLSRASPRYAVEVPKFSLDLKDISVKEIQRRYPNLYTPSDFFLVRSTWMDTFPMHQSFELGHACPAHIMRKGVQKIEIPDPEGFSEKFKDIPDILEPADASYIFKAKVMIPSMSNSDTIYRKACGVSDSATDPTTDAPVHIDRLISFIVGVKTSKHEMMALGGPWSPSLDGLNPQSDPQTLINTAIRSVRALTGLDLSRCKRWYRFMELYYKRTNCLETVVFYLPDVWNSLPGTKEWNKLKNVYKYALSGQKIEPREKTGESKDSKPPKDISQSTIKVAAAEENTSKESTAEMSNCVEGANIADALVDTPSVAAGHIAESQDDGANTSGLLVIDEAASPVREEGSADDGQLSGKRSRPSQGAGSGGSITEQMEGIHTSDNIAKSGSVGDSLADSMSLNEHTTVGSEDVMSATDSQEDVSVNGQRLDQPEPTHYSQLLPKNMNVVQLKDELNRRNLNAKGLKSQLTSRLVKALKEEESREKEGQEHVSMEVDGPVDSGTAVESVDKSNESDTLADSVKEEHAAPKVEPEIPSTFNEQEEDENEHCIRLVNPSLILESADDDISIEDGELKEDPDIGESGPAQGLDEFEQIFSKYPPDMFPIIKPGMKDDEIKSWERRYILPKNPRLLIHPSPTAKSGNFDCQSVTLGLLRDYRIIDKKEDGFEVSLFSEFFHEMLQRDFGFRIYSEIVAEANKETSEEQDSTEKDNEKDAVEPVSKKRKLSNASTANSNSNLKKTTDPYLLLSFMFFDVTRCGYITETDLEDLCSCIGVGLSRAQIRKVVQKVVHKGTLYYRKWTDRTDKSKIKTKADINEIRSLAEGNRAYFPIFVFRDDDNATSNRCNSDNEHAEAIIATVDGKNVDVKKLLDQLEKSEKDLSVAESSLNVLKNSLSESKSQVTDLKKSNEGLKDELAKVKEALKKSENGEKSSREHVETFKRASERYFERIKDLIKFPTTASSGKEKTENSNSSKTKEKSTTEVKDKSRSETGHSQSSTCNDASSQKEDQEQSSK